VGQDTQTADLTVKQQTAAAAFLVDLVEKHEVTMELIMALHMGPVHPAALVKLAAQGLGQFQEWLMYMHTNKRLTKWQ
jgi:hypothetical protein